MTKDEILEKWDALTPRERDAWVAEVVMGWTGRKTVYEWPDRKKHEYPIIIFTSAPKGMNSNYDTFVDENGVKIQFRKPHEVFIPPNYSTNISTAWEVVEKLKDEQAVAVTSYKGKTLCTICEEAVEGNFYECESETAPEAICKAALLAKGGEKPHA